MRSELRRFGDYQVVEEIESRGLAVTYRAHHDRLDRDVRIRALRTTVSISSPFAASLRHEAEVLSALGSEGVLALYELVETDTSIWIVFEEPAGPSLRGVMDAALERDRIAISTAVLVVDAIAEALSVVHEQGVCHRALRPSCIWFTPRGAVKLTGFSEASHPRLSPSPVPSELDRSAADGLEGLEYLTPEQLIGEETTYRTDVFVLGVLLSELISARHPFVSDDTDKDLAQQIRNERAELRTPPGTTAPPALRQVIERAMAKTPEHRFRDAADFMRALRALPYDFARRDHHIRRLLQHRPPEDTEPKEKPASSAFRPIVLRLLATGAAMLLGGAAIFAAFGEGDPSALASGPPGPGFLRVMAQPWAEIHIDGEHVDTTPVGQAIPVSPGRHYVQFRHPNAPDETRRVEVQSGQTAIVDVSMQIVRPEEGPGSVTSEEAQGGAGGRRVLREDESP